MDEYFNIKSCLVEKVSKNGRKYICLILYLTENTKKIVYLTDAEIELLKLTYID